MYFVIPMLWRLLFLLIRYAWASPATALGVGCAVLALCSGGRIRFQRGALETYGGLVSWFLRRGVPLAGGAAAMTLGHVILGRDRNCLDVSRDHEHVHVRQFERWGPLMIPLYLFASLLVKLRGGNAYLDNPFEREAYNRPSIPAQADEPSAEE